jgi:transcription elongation factor Elf1
MKYLLGKEKAQSCNHHSVEPCELNIEANVITYGCTWCGLRYDNQEEIINDLTNRKLKGVAK